MCSKMPKEFQKTTEVLPFTKYGLSTAEEFRKIESDIQHLELLKKIGLTNDEINLYQENEAGLIDQRKKIESNVLKSTLEAVYNKINDFQNTSKSNQEKENGPSSSNKSDDILASLKQQPIQFYPEGHPMNELKSIEEGLFSHLKNDILPINKRRKILRRLERKKEKILSQLKDPGIKPTEPLPGPSQCRPGSLWDVKHISEKSTPTRSNQTLIGPKKPTMYTIKDNKIVRLEPVPQEPVQNPEFRAVEIVIPINQAEEQLLEGTKMCLDDIKKIDRFKDYEPGVPSKVLFLKNISPIISQEQLMLLFNQFHLENGGPVDLRLMTGRMRGQAFVTFQNEDLAIRALEEVNGTIMGGRPIIAQFGRNSNRIQEENR